MPQDPDYDTSSQSKYECLDCGTVVTTTDGSPTCPDCGEAMRNVDLPME